MIFINLATATATKQPNTTHQTMKRTLRSLLLPVLTSMLFATAQAQVATYTFTGTRNSASAETYFGDTVTGTIIIDLGTAASTTVAQSGSYAEWRDLTGIAITAKATNFNGGTGSTTLLNDTVVQQTNSAASGVAPIYVSWDWLGFNQPDGSDVQQIQMSFLGPNSDKQTMDQIVDPGAYSLSLTLSDASHMTNFDVTSITLVSKTGTNIKIGGVDTGIKDFKYKGQSVNTLIAGYAATAKNHEAFVESVEALVEKLLKHGMLTQAQAHTLEQAAEKSSIGQKPKTAKDDNDKDD